MISLFLTFFSVFQTLTGVVVVIFVTTKSLIWTSKKQMNASVLPSEPPRFNNAARNKSIDVSATQYIHIVLLLAVLFLFMIRDTVDTVKPLAMFFIPYIHSSFVFPVGILIQNPEIVAFIMNK